MSKDNVSPNQLDDYLDRIEAMEKSKTRKKILLAVGLVVLLGGGFLAFRMIQAPTKIRSYALTELTESQVAQIFAEDPSPIGVTHPELGFDTLQSIEDYHSRLQLVQMIQQSQNQLVYDIVSDSTMDDEALAEEESLSQFVIDIAGDRKAGKDLTFRIEDYDPSVTYLMDFGNGFRRRIRQSYSYSYPSPGRFVIRLMATEGEKSSLYTKSIRISANSQPAQNVIAESQTNEEESASNTLEQEVNTPEFASSENINPNDGGESGPNMPDDAQPNLTITDLRGASDIEEIANDSVEEENLQGLEDEAAIASSGIQEATTPEPVVEKTTPVDDFDPSKPMLAAEVMPEYPGGTRGIARYFQRNNRYPTAARRSQIEGVVYVQFIVEKNGDLSNFKVVKGIGFGCDEEAIRLLDRMPKWIPGEHRNTQVAVYQTLPVTFKLVE
ncbi:MAG: energy transducer TonB [Bacteroidota bacterium]